MYGHFNTSTYNLYLYTNVQNTSSNMQHSHNLEVVFMHKNYLMLHCTKLKLVPDKNKLFNNAFSGLEISFYSLSCNNVHPS